MSLEDEHGLNWKLEKELLVKDNDYINCNLSQSMNKKLWFLVKRGKFKERRYTCFNSTKKKKPEMDASLGINVIIVIMLGFRQV